MNVTAIVSLAAVAAAAASLARASEDVVRLSEPVVITERHETFGAPMPDPAKALTLATVFRDVDAYLDNDVVVETRIAKVCQKKGCFFIATEGAHSARVTFKDYGFFIPTDAGGKTVELAGRFGRSAISAERAAHFAGDLGEAAPAQPPPWEYTIVATSVRIPK